VKNLRGVVLLDPRDDLTPNFLRWLNRRFRYRVLGISPLVLEGLRRRGFSPTRQVKPLHYPSKELSELVKRLSSMLGSVPEDVVESAVMASAYVSPLIVFGEPSRFILGLATRVVKTVVKLNNALLKLHMRIADYSILDYYVKNLELLERLWRGELSGKEFAELRKDMVVKDSKRYWRLTTQPGKGGKRGAGKVEVLEEPQPFLAYVDPLSLLVREGGGVEVIRDFSFEDVGAGLVIIPSVIIPPYIIGK